MAKTGFLRSGGGGLKWFAGHDEEWFLHSVGVGWFCPTKLKGYYYQSCQAERNYDNLFSAS